MEPGGKAACWSSGELMSEFLFETLRASVFIEPSFIEHQILKSSG
jgi:hypothetical protein